MFLLMLSPKPACWQKPITKLSVLRQENAAGNVSSLVSFAIICIHKSSLDRNKHLQSSPKFPFSSHPSERLYKNFPAISLAGSPLLYSPIIAS